jgi:hypothetical protein
MKKLLFLFLAFICSSCFEIKESIVLKAQGNGHYRLLIDFSQSSELVRQVIKATQDPGSNPFEGALEPLFELRDILDSGTAQIAYFKGIDSVKKIFDTDKFLMGFEFEFKRLENLNSVLNYMNYSFFKEKKQSFVSYSKKGEIALNNVSNLRELIQGLDNKLDTTFSQTKKLIAQTATYQLEFTFPKKVKKNRNYRFILSDDRRMLSLRVALGKLIHSETRVGNRIKFK